MSEAIGRHREAFGSLHGLTECGQGSANTTPKTFTLPKYRADIDGLRAVAVLSVVAYHAFPAWVGGGLVGVDIFFVISGFLISTILFGNLQNNSFSFLEFYKRRIRRIFPALIVVCSASIIVGWFWLLPDEYQQLGKHIIGGSAFVSNFMFLGESGYFDNAADTKPLLHLWSLGVEEQFYIVWPLLLWYAWKRNWSWTTITIPVLAISFILNVATAHRHPDADFYSPITRFWELLIGALLADPNLNLIISNTRKRLDHFAAVLLPSKVSVTSGHNIREFKSLFGVFLIGISLVTIDREHLYPFTWALLPTLGAAFIIVSSTHAWFNRKVLASRVLVWFGLISYPLYLWHWPLFSFVTIIEAGTPSLGVRIAVVILSILLAWLTYIIIEKPVRYGKNPNSKTLGAILAMIAVGSGGCIIYDANGFPSRIGSQIAIDLINYNYLSPDPNGKSEEEFWEKGCFNMKDSVDFFRLNGCEQKAFPDRPTVFLLGDSFSAYLSLGLKSYLHERELNLFQYSATCVLLSLKEDRSRCREISAHILEMIKVQKPDIVVIFEHYWAVRDMFFENYWTNQQANQHTAPHYHEGVPYGEYLVRKTRELEDLGVRKIVLIGQMPMWDAMLPKVILRRFVRFGRPVPERTYEGIVQASLQFDDKLKRLEYPSNVIYVSLKDNLCNSSGCVVKVGPNISKDLLVWDTAHLTQSGAIFVAENILSKVIP